MSEEINSEPTGREILFDLLTLGLLAGLVLIAYYLDIAEYIFAAVIIIIVLVVALVLYCLIRFMFALDQAFDECMGEDDPCSGRREF